MSAIFIVSFVVVGLVFQIDAPRGYHRCHPHVAHSQRHWGHFAVPSCWPILLELLHHPIVHPIPKSWPLLQEIETNPSS